MLGLIKKDLSLLKGNIKIILLITIVYLAMSKGKMDQFAFLLSFISIMFSLSTFSYDAYNHWDTFACALPNGRKNIVLSKYLSGIISLLFTSIFLLITGLIINTFISKIILNDLLTLMLISSLVVLIIESIMYPFIFKFGIEKGRYIIFIGSFLIGSLSALTIKLDNKIVSEALTLLDNYWLIIVPLLAIIMLTISIIISYHIYKHKEF